MSDSSIAAKFFKSATARKYSSRRMEHLQLGESEEKGALCSS